MEFVDATVGTSGFIISETLLVLRWSVEQTPLCVQPQMVGWMARYKAGSCANTLGEERYQYFWIVRKCLVSRRFHVLPPE